MEKTTLEYLIICRSNRRDATNKAINVPGNDIRSQIIASTIEETKYKRPKGKESI